MLVGIQPQPHMAGEDLVLLLPELRVELPGRAPCGGAVFLSVPCPALSGSIETQPHEIRAGADENGQQTLVCPLDVERVLQGGSQVGE